MSRSQVKWASCHDWYIGFSGSAGQYTVWVRGDVGESDRIAFSNFHLLRNWAGY